MLCCENNQEPIFHVAMGRKGENPKVIRSPLADLIEVIVIISSNSKTSDEPQIIISTFLIGKVWVI